MSKNTVKVLYFASLADKLGCAQEQFDINTDISDIELLKNALSKRGRPWEHLQSPDLLIAINQTIVQGNPPISADDEIAFFPPVTGG